MKLTHAAAATAASALMGLAFLGAAGGQPADEAPAEESEVALLEQIVDIREGQVRAAAIGELSTEEDAAMRVQLLRDRARLAEAKGDREALKTDLDEVVKILEEQLVASRALYDAGRLSSRELADKEIELLEARLERVKLLSE